MLLNLKGKTFKYKKAVVISVSVLLLNLIFGFDPKFTIINLIWLLV
jgi:hypothetical protein